MNRIPNLNNKQIVLLGIVAYIGLLSFFTISRHDMYSTYAWDLGIFNQAFWTTINSDKLFYYTCELYFVPKGSFFGIHFSPILILLLPFYSLFQNPEMLLFLQTIIIGIGAYPLYLIYKEKNIKNLSLIFPLLYLINPIIHGINSYDFHVQIFIPTLFFWSYYFYERGNTILHFFFIILMAFVQEQVSYIIVFIGVWEI